MKTLATYLFLFFISYTMVCSQSVIPKSLYPLMESPNDTHKVNQIIEQARMYTPGILQLGDELSDSALVAAREIDYLPGLVQAYRTKAQVATFRGNLKMAIEYYDQALALCGQDPKFKRNRISMVLSKGIVCFLEEDMDKALAYYRQAELSCDGPEFDDLLGKAYHNMILAYRKLENYEDAIGIYLKILPIKEALEDSLGIATAYNDIGVSYAFLGDHERSLEYLEKAKNIFEQIGQWDHLQNVELSKASSLYELGKKAEAKTVLIAAFEYGDMNIPFYDLMQGKLLFAKLWLEEESFEKANDLLQELDPRIENTPYLADLQNYLLLRATASHGLKKNEDAYQYLKEFDFLRDTLVNLQRQKLEQKMEAKYLTREKVDQIALQLAQLERNRRERLIYIVAVIALLGIMGLGYALYRHRQKANRLLSLKNAQIEKSLEEKEILLKEIHHRVKNNLQIISSLLNLQSRQITDPKALEAIQEGRNRVASMALIHKNLYQEDNLVGVNAADYIDKLTDSLMASYQVSEQKVSFEKDIDPVQLDVDVVIPLGLILNEVITNCLKYAFDEKDKGLIQMSLKEKTEGLRLRVVDNGKGLPTGFDVEQLSSLGFRLIKAFTQKLEAGLTISSVAGTQIEVFIPKHKLS